MSKSGSRSHSQRPAEAAKRVRTISRRRSCLAGTAFRGREHRRISLCAAGRIDEGRDRFLQYSSAPDGVPEAKGALDREDLLARLAAHGAGKHSTAASPTRRISRRSICSGMREGNRHFRHAVRIVFWQDSLLLALRTREPMRLIRALAFMRPSPPLQDAARSKSVQRQLKLCRQLAEDIGSPAAARGALALTGAIHFYNLGDWPQALREYTRAEKILVEECRGLNWELSFARAGKLWTLLCSGDPLCSGGKHPRSSKMP